MDLELTVAGHDPLAVSLPMIVAPDTTPRPVLATPSPLRLFPGTDVTLNSSHLRLVVTPSHGLDPTKVRILPRS